MGKTAEGRTQLSVIVSSPENLRNLEHYRQIARSLALAESLTDEQAHALAKEGKAVVWIDGGLHASEVLGAQQLAEMVWQMVSRNDEETMRFLNDDIIVFVHANPDGNQLTADWYNRDSVPEHRTNAPGLPRLYQKYIGHDDNRDFYGSTQAETKNMNRWMYHEWFPQIVYNHHQTGPEGTVMFSPPFRDPFNYYFDPLIVEELDLAAAAMHTRFEAEGKPGVTMRSGSLYSTWWNGGLRTTAYFHNMIGILTETIGNPTPMRIPYTPTQVLPRGDLPDPIAPQEWHFRQSIEYSITANRALLDLASRYRETLLFNIYRMGKNAIDRGNKDTWTITPSRVDRANATLGDAGGRGGRGGRGGGRGGRGAGAAGPDPYQTVLHAPDLRDPRGYIIPSDQPDFLTAIKFVNALREVNVTVNRATAPFAVNGKNYPAGSFVIFTAQAFRPHVLDMFEPQDHPNDFPYPGAPPTPPYDNAGWTLAYQMGVRFDRVLDGFTGPFVRVTDWNVPVPAGKIAAVTHPAGYLISHEVNDAFRAVAQLLSAKEDVFWLEAPLTAGGKTYPAGTLYVPAKGTTAALVTKIATETGVSFDATANKPSGNALKLKAPRIGLLDIYGGSMPSGWTRWILEQWGIAYDRTFPPRLDAGNLNAKYDVLILPSGLMPNPWGGGRRGGGGGGGDQAPGAGGGGAGASDSAVEASLPAEYRNERGRVSAEKTIPAIQQFIANGGTVIAYGSSSSGMAAALGLPVSSHLTEGGTPLPNTKFYIPGSVMRATVDTTLPIAAGMSPLTDVFFESDPVFDLAPDAAAKGVKRIAWYDGKTTLRSGWAWGQEYLDGGTAAIEATIGKGRALLFGPEILQRAQPHATFKLFFNGLYYGSGTPAKF
jgi:hypothetical protein